MCWCESIGTAADSSPYCKSKTSANQHNYFIDEMRLLCNSCTNMRSEQNYAHYGQGFSQSSLVVIRQFVAYFQVTQGCSSEKHIFVQSMTLTSVPQIVVFPHFYSFSVGVFFLRITELPVTVPQDWEFFRLLQALAWRRVFCKSWVLD